MARQLFIAEISGPSKSLYLLTSKSVLVSGIFISQKRNIENSSSKFDMVSYISYADSTGFFRGSTGSFFREILCRISGLVVCFSCPSKELIFSRSSLNPSKQILSPRELFKFWNTILSCRSKTQVWSNYEENNSHPYQTITEIPSFPDDPKTKLKKYFENVDDLFAGLLARSDFVNGSLIFSLTVNAENPSTRHLNTDTEVEQSLSFLRDADFSTLKAAKISTRRFFKNLNIKKEAWKVPSTINLSKIVNESEPKKIIPRTK